MNMHLQGEAASDVAKPNAGRDVSKQRLDVCLQATSRRLGNKRAPSGRAGNVTIALADPPMDASLGGGAVCAERAQG